MSLNGDCPWAKFLNSPSDDNLKGWVSTLSEWEEVRKHFESSKSLHFVGNKKGDFGQVKLAPLVLPQPSPSPGTKPGTNQEEEPERREKCHGNASTAGLASHYVRFADRKDGIVPFDGVPFMVVSVYTLGCMYGRNKHKCSKQREEENRENELKSDHPTGKRRRRRMQGSKKKGCPATIKLKQVIRFPQFKSKYACDEKSQALRKAIQNGVDLQVERRIYISLPSDDAHNNTHQIDSLTGFLNPINKAVKEKIHELVGHGVQSVQEMKRHLRIYVESILFPDPETRPATTHAGFYPSDQTLRNHIYIAVMALRYSKLDQENLRQQVDEWKQQNPSDSYLLRLASAEPTGDFEVDEDDDEVVPVDSSCSSAFFFAHQTEFQRHLLHRYGNDLCFLDATYKTTRYALPLFFLAVKTNIGYSVVGEFVVQVESKAAILEGLSTIKMFMKQANLSWEPACFLTDFCERELSAIEELFPATKTYICDFHREQAWTRWVNKAANGVMNCKEKVLAYLRRCAHASSHQEFHHAVRVFQGSEVWKKNSRLQQWITKAWLPHCKRWAWAYRKEEGLKAHTNNGLERQNGVFKHKFLTDRSNFSISGMISALLNDYLPSRKKQYIMANVKADAAYGRSYDREVPHYLCNRPPAFTNHCLTRLESSQALSAKDIERTGLHTFQVNSESLKGHTTYLVNMSSSSGTSLICECMDWLRSRLPCKHIFAVMTNVDDVSWDSLPCEYRESPFHTLDRDVGKLVGDSLTEHTEEDYDREECETATDDLLPSRASLVRRVAISCREKLLLLRDMTYICKEEELLQKMETQLQSSLQFMRQHLSNEDGLIPDTETPKVQAKAQKRKRKASTECLIPDTETPKVQAKAQKRKRKASTELPLRKKKTTHRVGTKAKRRKTITTTQKQKAGTVLIDGYFDIFRQARKAQSASQGEDVSQASHVLPSHSVPSSMPVECKPQTPQPGSMFRPDLNETKHHQTLSEKDKKKKVSFAAQTFLSSKEEDTKPLLVELTSDKNVAIPKKKKLRYHVGGDVIEHRDFKSLVHPNWLNDKVINAYLHLLRNETNRGDSGHIFIMPSYVAVQWRVDGLDPWLFKKVKLSKFAWIFLPININQNHWILLAAYVPALRVSLLDSLPGNDNSIYIEKFREYMRCRSEVTGELEGEWIHDNQLLSAKQSDGSSCGAFVMLNALALSRNIQPRSLGQVHAVAMRKYVLAKFLGSSVKPPSQQTVCDIVGCSKPGLPSKWVACDVCGRWCHFKCVNVSSRPKGGYVCPICIAQYE